VVVTENLNDIEKILENKCGSIKILFFIFNFSDKTIV
jgi:hypothetical protein